MKELELSVEKFDQRLSARYSPFLRAQFKKAHVATDGETDYVMAQDINKMKNFKKDGAKISQTKSANASRIRFKPDVFWETQ